MKRSTQIAIGAAGIVLVATIFVAQDSRPDPDENLVYANLNECRAGGQLSGVQCEQRFNEARANHLRDTKKFSNTAACESEFGSGSCQSATWNGAAVVVPALAGIMLARALSQGGGAAQPLLPPTRQACPPGSQAPECQQARSSPSGGGGGGGGGSRGGNASRAFTTTSGTAVVARQGTAGGAMTAPGVASRGGFGSTSRSFGSSSS